jgi:hypothetical protein
VNLPYNDRHHDEKCRVSRGFAEQASKLCVTQVIGDGGRVPQGQTARLLAIVTHLRLVSCRGEKNILIFLSFQRFCSVLVAFLPFLMSFHVAKLIRILLRSSHS